MRSHAGPVWGVAFTPDGARLLAGSADGRALVWDAAGRWIVRELVGHTAALRAVAVTPDGRGLTASADGTVRVWDLEAGHEVGRLHGHEGGVYAVAAWGPERAVTGGYDATVRTWDLRSGACLAVLRGHAAAVQGVAIAPDGIAVSASRDRTLRLWDLGSGRALGVLGRHGEWVSEVRLAADGRRALSAAEDGSLHVWDLPARERRCALAVSEPVWGLALSPDGRIGLAGSAAGSASVFDLDRGVLRGELAGHGLAPRAIAVSPDGRHAATGGDDSSLRLWRLDTLACTAHLEGAAPRRPSALALGPDLRTALVATWDGTLGRCEVDETGGVETLATFAAPVYALSRAPDGHVLSAGFDGTVRVWDALTGRELACLEGGGLVFSVAVTPDARHVIAAADAAGRLVVWRRGGGRELRRLAGHPGERHLYLAALPDARRVVSGGEDGTLHVWEIDTGTRLASLRPRAEGVSCMTALDGDRVGIGWCDGPIGVVDVRSGQTRTLPAHEDWVREIALAQDGRHLVSVCQDHGVAVHDVATGERVAIDPPGVQTVSIAPATAGRVAVAHPDGSGVRFIRFGAAPSAGRYGTHVDRDALH